MPKKSRAAGLLDRPRSQGSYFLHMTAISNRHRLFYNSRIMVLRRHHQEAEREDSGLLEVGLDPTVGISSIRHSKIARCT
jgi:hypothetical protein